MPPTIKYVLPLAMSKAKAASVIGISRRQGWRMRSVGKLHANQDGKVSLAECVRYLKSKEPNKETRAIWNELLPIVCGVEVK